MPTTQDLYDDWVSNPERSIFMVDETRADAPAGHGQFIVFTCVAMSVEAANHFLNRMEEARQRLPAQIRNMNFKGKKLFGPRAFGEIADAVLEGLRTSKVIERVMTTDKYVADKASTTVTELRTDTGIRITGPELSPVLHLAKYVGMSIQPVPPQIDLILDRSVKMGLDHRQTGISKQQFTVLAPDFLNEGPGGRPTSMVCPSPIRIIAGSDDLLHLRDLLLLPDATGYVGMFKTDMSAVQQEVLAGNDLRIIHSDLSLMQPPVPMVRASAVSKK